ncbi:hypothetical protein SAMN05444487_10557 [Marininema mesophilum]|uniref:Uncharacterized protein n=1 Tax=Marininema mesophilum TaxID=1048340 RepID=A0A1H2VBZ7_9BACL|nr:hypothetical protein [Marininema mesophilum]SDW65855.1 hypothetical protein SAMN05444487_10557 [Marininema mesophilum]
MILCKANMKTDSDKTPIFGESSQQTDSKIIPFPTQRNHPAPHTVSVQTVTSPESAPLVITEVSSGFGSSSPRAMLVA